MICQFCGSKIRGSKHGCKKCKPKLISAYFEAAQERQLAVVISANNKTFAGYLPVREIKEE